MKAVSNEDSLFIIYIIIGITIYSHYSLNES